jgi:hypothetical protein
MKTPNFLVAIVFVIPFLFFCCTKDKSAQLHVSGFLVSHTECKKGLDSTTQATTIADSLSCIAYSFNDLTNKLILIHINAGFNCCIDRMYCTIIVRNDSVIIQEFEESQNCKCNCLYDLDIVINGVESKKYKFRFIEPYCGEQKKIIFGLDLANHKQGLICFARKQYPWSASN